MREFHVRLSVEKGEVELEDYEGEEEKSEKVKRKCQENRSSGAH